MAQLALGQYYSTGQFVPKNTVEAIRWWKAAADKGNAKAKGYLGKAYLLGDGVEKDYEKASLLLRQSARNGFVVAQYYLGTMYSDGLGLEKNQVAAIALWKQAANQVIPPDPTNALAQDSLAHAYATGDGIQKNVTLAYAWYDVAAWMVKTAANDRDDLKTSMTDEQIAMAKHLSEKWKAAVSKDFQQQMGSDIFLHP